MTNTPAVDPRSLRRLVKRLKGLPELLRKKALVDGTKAGGRVLVRPLKSSTPKRTGALRRAQTLKRTRYRQENGAVGFKVRPPRSFTGRLVTDDSGKTKFKRDPKDAYGNQTQGEKKGRIRPSMYAHLVEYGHKRGAQPTHFASRTLAAHSGAVLSAFAAHIRRALRPYQ